MKLFALACALASVSSAIAFPQYRLEFLRDIDGVELLVPKINDRGDIIAYRPNFGGIVAFVNGQRYFVSESASANFGITDINEQGVAAVYTDDGRMYTWSVQTGLVELPRPSASPSTYRIHAINDNGTIVGRQFSADGSFAISDFTITADRQVIVHHVAYVGLDINNSDRAVGAAGDIAGFYRDLGSAEQFVQGFGTESRPELIDDDGTMYGTGFDPNFNPNARLSILRWQTPDTVEELYRGFWQGDIYSSGNGLLAASFSPIRNGRATVHVWSGSSGFVNTADLLDSDSRALNLIPFTSWDLNASGVISVDVRQTDQSIGFRSAILRPVPEPGTMLVLGAGLIALLRRKRTT